MIWHNWFQILNKLSTTRILYSGVVNITDKIERVHGSRINISPVLYWNLIALPFCIDFWEETIDVILFQLPLVLVIRNEFFSDPA